MKIFISAILWSILITPVVAQTSIAILAFELQDLTLAPGIPAEKARTASLQSQLESELRGAGYKIISINDTAQREANAGFGYLFDHPDSAAKVAKNAGANYILVGRLHKPSFLFAYIMGHLINAQTGQLIGNYVVETKGGDKKLSLKGIESLADKIDADLDNIYTPPPPSSITSKSQGKSLD